MNSSRAFLHQIVLAFAVLLFPVAPSLAQSDAAKSPRVVLKGHDPVAYFTEGKPVKGDPKVSHDWDGERYLFANAGNRSKFTANPDRYAPQFGGYCTGTMARGGRAEADPEAWMIADGKLFLFGQVKFRDMAAKDAAWLAKTVVASNEYWRAKK